MKARITGKILLVAFFILCLGGWAKAQEVRNAAGELIATINNQDGKIVMADGTTKGYYIKDEKKLLTEDRQLWGYISGETSYFSNNIIAGHINLTKNAALSNPSKEVLGYVANDGIVTDCKKNILGTAVGVDKELAILTIFHIPLFGKQLNIHSSLCESVN